MYNIAMKLELLQMARNFLDIISGFLGGVWERKKKVIRSLAGLLGQSRMCHQRDFWAKGYNIYYMKHAAVSSLSLSDVQLWMIQYKASG
jgi:hypothetical protein